MLRRPVIVVLLAAACGPSRSPEPVGSGPVRFALRGRWPGLSPASSIAWRAEPADAAPLSAAAFETAIRAALDEWQATGLVAFRPAADGEEAELVLGWRRGAHGAACLPFGVDTAIAHTGPVGPGTFVHFDLEREWDPGRGGYDLAAAALHEVGHALGLDHTPDESAVMYAEPSGRRQLGRSDRLGLRTLYADPSEAAEPGSLRVFLDEAVAPRATLRAILPAEAGRWTLFDADGDGRDELLLWPLGEAAELWAFHFDGQGRPERTVGPLLGVAGHGAELRFGHDAQGARVVVVAFGERCSTLGLDDLGRPMGVHDGAPPPEALEPFPRATGDVTGDGRRARIGP